MAARIQWEYRRRVGFVWNEMVIMREMGEEGWELCSVWAFWMYFKRQKQPRAVSGRRAAYA